MYFVGKPGMYNPGISRFSLFSVQSLLFSVLGEVSGDAPLYLNTNMPGPVGFLLLKNSFGKGFSGGDVALRKKVNWSRHHSFWKKPIQSAETNFHFRERMSKKLEDLSSTCVIPCLSSVSLLSLEKVLLSCLRPPVSAFEGNSSEFAVKHFGKLEKIVKESVCTCMCVSMHVCKGLGRGSA